MPRGKATTVEKALNQKKTQYKPAGYKAFDAGIHLKLQKEKKEKLRTISNWTDKLRAAIDKLIEEEEKASPQQNTT